MTDPGAAERLAALRSTRPARRDPRSPHAQAAKILTAGVSTSMVLGIVSYMAHSANVQAAAQAREDARQAATQILADKIAKPPLLPPVVAPVAPGLAPVGPPSTATPAPRVVVVPVPKPATPSTKQPSSKPATTSRSSK